MNQEMESFSRKIRACALTRWTSQTRIPNSPGAFNSAGTYDLCLGATIAEAITTNFDSAKAAKEFVMELATSGSKQKIVDQLARFGFSRQYAWSKIRKNDATRPSHRRKKLLQDIISISLKSV